MDAIVQGQIERWVQDATINLTACRGKRDYSYLRRCKVEALVGFEEAKHDPEGSPLLCAASDLLNDALTEVQILDTLLARTGRAWDIQPDVLRYRDVLDAIGAVEDAQEDIEAGKRRAVLSVVRYECRRLA